MTCKNCENWLEICQLCGKQTEVPIQYQSRNICIQCLKQQIINEKETQ